MKEWHKSKKDYDDVLVRFRQFTSRGESDPVFENIEELLFNQHIAKAAVQNSLWISEEFERIKAEYPNINEDIILKWINAGKTKRYEAIGYLPQSDNTFRYTTLDLEIVRAEIKNVIEELEDTHEIQEFACNIYTALIASKIYNVNLDLFKDNADVFLNSNQLSLRAASDPRFKKIGVASEQTNLDRAAYLATIGKPVIALRLNPIGKGHTTLLLPGLTDFRSGSWERYVPRVTNYQWTQENICSGCFIEGPLSEAFASDKMNSIILYQLEY